MTSKFHHFNIYLLLAECEVRTASYGPSFFLPFMAQARRPWKQGRKKRGSITCHMDRANEANKMFIIWLCWLFRFWKGDGELEVRTATYGPGIDQSQHAKSVSHIIMYNNTMLVKSFKIDFITTHKNMSCSSLKRIDIQKIDKQYKVN